MGWFALLIMIISILFRIGRYISGNVAHDIARASNVSKDGLTYVDNNGKIRLVSNGHLVAFERRNGHEVLKDLKTFAIIRDYTQEKKNIEYKKSRERAKAAGKDVFCIDYDQHRHDKIMGMRYRDMKTGDEYVIRLIGKWEIPFYMTLDGEKFVPVDKNWKPPKLFGIGDDITLDLDKELKTYLETRDVHPLWGKACNHLWNGLVDYQYCGKEFGKDEV